MRLKATTKWIKNGKRHHSSIATPVVKIGQVCFVYSDKTVCRDGILASFSAGKQ